MDRNVSYEVLVDEEEQVPAQPVAMAMVIPPPPYRDEDGSHHPTGSPGISDTVLPSYKDATTLPTYEEAERAKEDEANRMPEDLENPAPNRISDIAIGTDGMFLCTFVIAFLFNWIGFLLSLCISNTIAGRCGALAGLGLSIVKWVAIVKHNNWAQDFASGDSWLWWILVICGFMLFIRGSIQYVRIKFEWKRLTGHVRQYRLI